MMETELISETSVFDTDDRLTVCYKVVRREGFKDFIPHL
jgi:hypothetical protein